MVEGLFMVTETSTVSLVTGGGALAIVAAAVAKVYSRNTTVEDRSRNDMIAAITAINSVTAALKDVVKTTERHGEHLARVERLLDDIARKVAFS